MKGTKLHKEFHNDGSIWAKGRVKNGKPHGYWEWYRKGNAGIMRSGHFTNGKQTGEWVTYDRKGKAVKITDFGETKT